MIKVKGLTKRFGTTVAVKNVTFQVPKGEVLGFLGPNGAGKSTTMRILTGYMPADEGSGTVAGFDIFSQSLEVRKKIGYLPENAPLYLDMDVPDFLTFIATIRKIPSADQSKAIKKMVEVCGLESVLHKRIGELSKGFRQRVGLAQAMVHDPDILILDEPTSGLDPNQIVEIRDLIKKLGKEKTVILSTHILPEVTATCDRILIIHEGQLVADGSPQELAEQASGEITLRTTIKNGNDETILSKLKQLPGVKRVIPIQTSRDLKRFALKLSSGADPSEELFRLAVDQNWILTELFRETASLEDIFAKLTTTMKEN